MINKKYFSRLKSRIITSFKILFGIHKHYVLISLTTGDLVKYENCEEANLTINYNYLSDYYLVKIFDATSELTTDEFKENVIKNHEEIINKLKNK